MIGRAAAAVLSAAVLAAGCNVILDKEALKGERSFRVNGQGKSPGSSADRYPGSRAAR
jgi:hypothetical protein